MPEFSKSHFSRPSFGKKPFGKKSFGAKGGFDRGPKEMFKTDCAQCGKVCEVPFRPNGTRPVFCNDCFVKDDASRAPRRDFAPRPSFHSDRPAPRPDQAFNDLKAELRGVNERLERLIALMATAKTVSALTPSKASKKKAA
jgi:CxxC-x17-CxxC domain-containing protein